MGAKVRRDSLLSVFCIASENDIGTGVNSYGSKTCKAPRRTLASFENCDVINKVKSYETLHMFGVGRKTVERGRGGGSRTYGAATTTAGSLSVDVDGPPEGDSIA